MSELVKSVTFSFTNRTFAGTEAREKFTFEELEIDESLDEEDLGVELDRIYQTWIWDKINVSGSIVIDEPDTFQ
ncbi:hypothetical protein PGH26_10095 [Sporosarcina jeotgali]|uniref:Uncharacterized protein n=1 Tax=Sporosarcina jeotgali TaxID=3020056 RepID=A0ABZ0KUZ1_9BACL|nr:hypothetical protein [Sporosarcina sp. B2O-1]WOV83276.1 hypothetical protein PGH26_10095 [Sporosarcina sp. B2O-1]